MHGRHCSFSWRENSRCAICTSQRRGSFLFISAPRCTGEVSPKNLLFFLSRRPDAKEGPVSDLNLFQKRPPSSKNGPKVHFFKCNYPKSNPTSMMHHCPNMFDPRLILQKIVQFSQGPAKTLCKFTPSSSNPMTAMTLF